MPHGRLSIDSLTAQANLNCCYHDLTVENKHDPQQTVKLCFCNPAFQKCGFSFDEVDEKDYKKSRFPVTIRQTAAGPRNGPRERLMKSGRRYECER